VNCFFLCHRQGASLSVLATGFPSPLRLYPFDSSPSPCAPPSLPTAVMDALRDHPLATRLLFFSSPSGSHDLPRKPRRPLKSSLLSSYPPPRTLPLLISSSVSNEGRCLALPRHLGIRISTLSLIPHRSVTLPVLEGSHVVIRFFCACNASSIVSCPSYPPYAVPPPGRLDVPSLAFLFFRQCPLPIPS